MRSMGLVAIVVSLMESAALAQTVLVGVPEEKHTVSQNGAVSEALSGSAQIEARVVIERCGDAFCWATRGGEEMDYRSSGIYDIYIAQSGAGYVKVENSFIDGEPAQFLEHVHLGLATVTYFGTALEYDR